jgi:hypothetical protein
LAAKRKINCVSAGRGSASASAKAGFFFDPLDHFRNPFFERRVGEAHPRLFIISRILIR